MIAPIKAKEFIDNAQPERLEVVQRYETVDAMWGMDHVTISDSDIKALKEGKYLYHNDGEYATLVSYKEEENDNSRHV